jgi:hypothetical protein
MTTRKENMSALKLQKPPSGAPASGLLQFGDELPGLYLTADDVFLLRMALGSKRRDRAIADPNDPIDNFRDLMKKVRYPDLTPARKQYPKTEEDMRA